MELEDIVVSLPLAKTLKELGVKQDSCFYWVNCRSPYSINFYIILVPKENLNTLAVRECVESDPAGNTYQEYQYNDFEKWSAFTTDELGEYLPPTITVKEVIYDLDIERNEFEWGSAYREWDNGCLKDSIFCGMNKKESDARAETIINLINNGILKLPK